MSSKLTRDDGASAPALPNRGRVFQAITKVPWYTLIYSEQIYSSVSPMKGYLRIFNGTVAGGTPWLTQAHADMATMVNAKSPWGGRLNTTFAPEAVLNSIASAVGLRELCQSQCGSALAEVMVLFAMSSRLSTPDDRSEGPVRARRLPSTRLREALASSGAASVTSTSPLCSRNSIRRTSSRGWGQQGL